MTRFSFGPSSIPLTVVALVILASSAALAQRLTAAGGGVAAQAQAQASVPSTCNPCLYYSGDFDPSNPAADALFNGNAGGTSAQIWVPFAPTSDGVRGSTGLLVDKHILVSSITFNELVDTNPPTDVVKTTFAFRTFVSTGDAGVQGAHGTCQFVSATPTGRTAFGLFEYSFTCNLAKAVKLAVGINYWVNIYPTFTGSTSVAFLSDVTDVPAPNQFGFGDIFFNSYLNAPDFSINYTPTNSCGGCDEFSIAIGGTYTSP